MKRARNVSFLDESLELLVRYYGAAQVQVSLARLSNDSGGGKQRAPRKKVDRDHRTNRPSMAQVLELIRETDAEKHRLLSDFWVQLRERKILPESQDIRHFAQLVGLKQVNGKSRKEVIPPLMYFLLEQPTERLKTSIASAGEISEQQRQRGFSLLTDKLLGEK